MSTYRVYKDGEREPVRVEGPARPDVQPPGSAQRAQRRRATRSRSGLRVWLLRVAAAAAVIAVIVVIWLYGRDVLSNTLAALDLAKVTGKVPSWALVAAPVVAVLVVALVSVYLAFGRHVVVKSILLAVLVAALAAPGLALGWANGTVSTVGQATPEKIAWSRRRRRSCARSCRARP